MAWYIHHRTRKVEIEKTHISFDPGVANFAYSVVRNNNVIACGLLQHPMQKITPENFRRFKNEMRQLLNDYKPTSIGAERFLIRRFLTPFVEVIGLMLGWLENEAEKHGCSVLLFTASSWKLASKKHFNLKQYYKDGWKKPYRIPPHVLDTLCTTRYLLNNNKFCSTDKDWLYAVLPTLKVRLRIK